mmetsp:Transcript_110570/g.226193  ORF Transcript_110570/g.226193 Transcript_110570/m.226193 type:complete len:312 (-) Transcript_110570:68-1003(-)
MCTALCPGCLSSKVCAVTRSTTDDRCLVVGVRGGHLRRHGTGIDGGLRRTTTRGSTRSWSIGGRIGVGWGRCDGRICCWNGGRFIGRRSGRRSGWGFGWGTGWGIRWSIARDNWSSGWSHGDTALLALLLVLLVLLVLLLLDFCSGLDGLLLGLLGSNATPLFLLLRQLPEALLLLPRLPLGNGRLVRFDLLLGTNPHVIEGAEFEGPRACPRGLGPATSPALVCELAGVGARGDGVTPQGIQDPIGVLGKVRERPREGRLPCGRLVPGEGGTEEGAARGLHAACDVLFEAHVQVLDAFLSRLGRRNIHGS